MFFPLKIIEHQNDLTRLIINDSFKTIMKTPYAKNVILPSKLFHKLEVGRVLLHYFRVCLETRCKSYYFDAF